MAEYCKLREALGQDGVECGHDECVFWRTGTGRQEGCAIQYFDLLGGDDDLPAWLLAIKKRLEEA